MSKKEQKDMLILGPNPFNEKINHSGGQLTAITLLVNYLEQKNISYDIVDIFRSSFPPPPLSDKLKVSFIKYREVKRILNKKSYKGALIFGTHGLGYWEKLILSLLINSHKIKTLFFVRSGHFYSAIERKNYKAPIKRYLMNRLDYIGYQGGKWEELYNKIGIDKSRLVKILNWIDISDYKRSFTNKKVSFLYVGWMVKEKGVEELFEVIANHRDLDEYEFTFVGGGTLLDELKEKKEKQNLNNITFTGWLDSKDVAEYYHNTDALILPSHTEGFPNVILEALNYRLPIIATNVGGIPESVIDGYNGYILEPKDKNKLYSSIKSIGSSKELKEKFSKNSEEILIKNHTIENNCKTLFDLFNIKIEKD